MSTDVQNMPLRETMCTTCPFKEGSPYAYLAEGLIETKVGRICHMTGANNAIHKRTGKPPHLCRGARDWWNQHFAERGYIAEPTDAAWNEKRIALGMAPQVVKDPS